MMQVIDFFDEGALGAPSRPCLVDADMALSYGEVTNMTWRIASALRRRGFGDGSRTAIYSPNAARAFTCVLAIFRNGGIWVPLNPVNSVAENAAFLRKTAVEVLFIHPKFLPTLPALRAECSDLKLVVVTEGNAADGFLTLDGLLAEGDDGPSFRPVENPDALVTLYSTGGTTGEPKAVMFTNRMWETMIRTHRQVFPASVPPVHLVVAPMTHGAGGIALCLLSQGGTQIFMPGFDAVEVAEAVEAHHVTHLFLPPTAIYKMLDTPAIRARDFSSLTHFFYAAAPISVDRLREALALFGPVMVQTYGQTECPLLCTVLSQQDHVEALAGDPERLKSCGRPTPLISIAIMNADGQLVDPGVTGEIVMRGGLVTPGYMNAPEQTAEIQRDGWHHSGDVGFLDEAGYLHIVDRLKDMIISGGFNIYPAEVEKAVMAHPAVADCVVIGVPDLTWGETVKAVVQLKPGATAAPGDIIDLCKQRLGSVKAPKTVEVWPDLPRSPVGKTLRRKVREIFWQGAGRVI